MRHIEQRNHLDCGLAVAAMLADRGYADARAADCDPQANHGLWVREMLEILNALTDRSWRVSRRRTLPDLPAALIIRRTGRIGHWIAWDGTRFIHDPERAGKAMATAYFRDIRRGWRLIRSITAV